jgi:predicted secreted hydrolase
MAKRLPLALAVCALVLGCNGDENAPGADSSPADARLDGGPPDSIVKPDTRSQGIELPRDERPHSEQMEWWYYTGRLEADGGEVYGFELTVFQPMIGNKPVYIAHFAITDVGGDAFHAVMDVNADDQRDAVKEGFKIKVNKTIEMAGGGGKDSIKGAMDGGHGLELQLAAAKPPVLQYGDGKMTIGSDLPFFYYSYTRMTAKGSITIGGTEKAVTGLAWMDHQWGTIGTGYGWDWFSLRLDDETEVMLFEVRRTGKTGFVGGTFIDKSGKATELAKGDFTTTPLGQWTSPHTKITYSHGWQIQVPSLNFDVEVIPTVADQEFNHNFYGSPIYWEGLCDVKDRGGSGASLGHAYVEITGNWK